MPVPPFTPKRSFNTLLSPDTAMPTAISDDNSVLIQARSTWSLCAGTWRLSIHTRVDRRASREASRMQKKELITFKPSNLEGTYSAIIIFLLTVFSKS